MHIDVLRLNQDGLIIDGQDFLGREVLSHVCKVVFTKYHLVLFDDAVYRWLDLVFRCFDQVSAER